VVRVKTVVTIGPEADIREAVKLMLTHKIGCVPVVAGGELLGLITETDILRLYLEQLSGVGRGA
jgi:CBS domain-containing protein